MALATRPPERPTESTEAQQQVSTAGAPGEKHALILAGAGRFRDDLHDFRQTSECLRGILEDNGFAGEVSSDVDGSLAGLDAPDLLVLNLGSETAPDLILDSRDHHGLLRYLSHGGPLLVMHRTCVSLPAIPEWEDITGVAWIRGTSHAAGYGTGQVHVDADRHPIVAGLGDFEIRDDLYCYLRTRDDVVPLLTHKYDGIEHPLLWARSYGPSRVVFDALGHDEASFASPEHREILGRAGRWLAGAAA